MKRLKKIISSLIIVFILLVSFSAATNAQENLFDTLDDIKEKVEGDTGRTDHKGDKINVKVIDFSEDRPWGNLESETIDKLKKANIVSLKDLAQKAGYLDSKKNTTTLAEYIGKIGFAEVDKDGAPVIDQNGNTVLSDKGSFILSEVVYSGESQIRSTIIAVIKVIRNLIAGIAIIWIIISGIQMVMANGDESKITQSRQSILYITLGLVVILLIDRMITVIYGVPGATRGLVTENAGLNEEISGIIAFVRTITGAIVMLFIVISGFKTIVAQGEEEKIKNERKSILWIIVGVVVVVVNQLVIENLFLEPNQRLINGQKDAIVQSNVENLINLMGSVMQFLLGFVGIIAFGAFVFAGASMILNYGNDEQNQKSRKLMINSIIGIIIVLSAFAIVSTVIKFE